MILQNSTFSSFSLAFRSIRNDPGIWLNIVMRLYSGGPSEPVISVIHLRFLIFLLFLWFFPVPSCYGGRLIHFCASRWVRIKILLFTFIWSFELVFQLRMYERNRRQILVIDLHAGVRNGYHHSSWTPRSPQFVVWLFYVGLLPVFNAKEGL